MTQSLTKAVADFSKQLGASVSINDTTATLNNGLDADGVQITNDKLYGFTVDTGSKKEYIIATLSSNNQLSGIVSISRQGVATAGFQKTHQVGATIQITDWALLSRVVNLLDGTTDFDAGTPLKYDGAPSQVNPTALATVQFVLDTASGSTVLAFNPQTIDGKVGENVTAGDWVYFNTTDGKWYKTKADDATRCVGVKIGKVRATTLAEGNVVGGIFIGGTETVVTYTSNTTYYLSNTAGELSTTAGTIEILIGVGDNNGDLVMLHNNPNEISPDLKAALAGGGDFGTPSTSNKFVTEEKLEVFSKFGGTGADGALTVSSGTTNIDLAGAQIVVKNYTSISITGTGKITFSNPHANGTTIVFKSQGNVTLTSSEAPMIDASGMGGSNARSFAIFSTNSGGAGSGSTPGTGGVPPVAVSLANSVRNILSAKYPMAVPGSNGGASGADQRSSGGGGGSVIGSGSAGSGGNNILGSGSSLGGKGGGALIIECGGSLNFTTASGISVRGLAGENAVGDRGSGGGGGGGVFICFYNALTANSGTVTVTGGIGGTGLNSSAGGNGGVGFSLIAQNTEFL